MDCFAHCKRFISTSMRKSRGNRRRICAEDRECVGRFSGRPSSRLTLFAGCSRFLRKLQRLSFWQTRAVNRVSLDTSRLIATVVTDDQWHSCAEPIRLDLIPRNTALFATSLVANEIGDALCTVLQRDRAIDFLDRLQNASRVEIAHVTAERQGQGRQVFRDQPHMDWGVTDCVSFAHMRQYGIRVAFTNDRHFEQAGFKRLVKKRLRRILRLGYCSCTAIRTFLAFIVIDLAIGIIGPLL